MPLQKPISFSISRSKRVRCSMRWWYPTVRRAWNHFDAFRELNLDRFDRAQRGRIAASRNGRRIDREGPGALEDVPGQRIEDADALHLVVEERRHRALGVLRRKDVEHVAAHPEDAAPELEFVALILHFAYSRWMASR